MNDLVPLVVYFTGEVLNLSDGDAADTTPVFMDELFARSTRQIDREPLYEVACLRDTEQSLKTHYDHVEMQKDPKEAQHKQARDKDSNWPVRETEILQR